jgi:hypothetical protein
MFGVHIADLDPDHRRTAGRAGSLPGDIEQPSPKKKTSPDSSGGPDSR